MNEDFKTHMDTLVSEYEEECCKFDEETCIELLEFFMSRMEDCHLRCVLYKHLFHLRSK